MTEAITDQSMFLNVSTLIFDLDGTISDPSQGIYRCFNYSLEEHDLPLVSFEQIAALIGPPLDQSFAWLYPDADQSLIESLVKTYRLRYAESGYAENRLYPGIRQSIHRLAESGIPLGICTSKRRDFAVKILSMFDLLSYFSFVSGGDIGISKSTQLSWLLEQETVDQSAVMIGDRDFDILAAKSNRLKSTGVLWGFGDYHELSNAGADMIVNKTGQLASLFID